MSSIRVGPPLFVCSFYFRFRYLVEAWVSNRLAEARVFNRVGHEYAMLLSLPLLRPNPDSRFLRVVPFFRLNHVRIDDGESR